MYARLINLKFGQSVTHDQADALCQDIVSEFRQIEGFRGYSFMLMPNARRGLAMTFWNDEACASAAGARVLPTIVERMRGLLAEAPEITGYEVVVYETIDHRSQ